MHKRSVCNVLAVLVLLLAASSCVSSDDAGRTAAGEPASTAGASGTPEQPPPSDASSSETEPTPAPAGGGTDAAVEVTWLDEGDQRINYRDRTVDWGGFPDWTMEWRGSKVTIGFEDNCGDECVLTKELVLRDRNGTPEFVSYNGQAIDYFDDWERHWEGNTGLLEIGRWDPDAEIISGRFWIGEPDEPSLTFVFDETDRGLFARHAREEVVTFDEIDAALTSGDDDRALDAYMVLENHEARYSLGPLQQPLLALVGGGSNADPDIAFGAALLLGESIGDFVYIAFRQPAGAFRADVTDPEQAEQVRANWQVMIDASARPTPTVYEDGVTPFVGLTVAETNAVAGVYASGPRCETEPEGCVFLSLQCNLVAVWNEGNELFTTRWTIADGGLVLLNSPPTLDTFVGAEPSGELSRPFKDITTTRSRYCG